MEHVVFFPAPDGSPAFRRIPNLEEAVRLVEHLRNVEGVSSVSVHALTEVPLAFRAYYRVEVPADVAVPAQQVSEPAPAVEQAPVAIEPEHIGVEPAQVDVAEAPALALVEDIPADSADDSSDDSAPSGSDEELAASNGHAQPVPASLGFFA